MKFKILTIAAMAALLGACGSDEPKPNVNDDDVITVKDDTERKVLIGAQDGKVYNMADGSVYADYAKAWCCAWTTACRSRWAKAPP